jgi:UDP-N-acetylmuramoyl-L-alanyl-D-glutamate--2,6-diaminopimelate ligase
VKLVELLQHVSPLEVQGPVDRAVDRITRDSREVTARSVFVAIRGEKVDGHRFAPTVDAAAVVVETPGPVRPGVTQVVVPSTRRALAALAAALFGHPGQALRVVGVTGTNGKTTVTTLIEQALVALHVPVGRIGTTGHSVNGAPLASGADAAFTTPEAPALQALLATMREDGVRVVAMEVSSIGLAQHRADGIPYAIAVFTNLSRDHLDFHGTMDAYKDAKARLFAELLAPHGVAILNADDPVSAELARGTTYGFAATADVRIADTRLHDSGTKVTLVDEVGSIVLDSPLVGRHNASNLAATYAVLRALGIARDDAARAAAAAKGAPGRLERIPDSAGRLVLVDYAHSDDALANVLPAVRELVAGTVWVVFGCGGDRDRGKRPAMGAVASRLADRVVVTSDNPRTEDPAAIVADILGGIADRSGVVVEIDRERAIRTALAGARRGDAVLVAGKGHETTQEVAGVKRPFDDRVVARRILQELGSA